MTVTPFGQSQRLNRRHVLGIASWSVVMGYPVSARATQVVAVRLWPSPLYTRLTIESDRTIGTRHHYSDFPPRLVVELDDLVLNPLLADIGLKIQSDDPNVASIRVNQLTETTVRIQIDLKQAAAPQVFALNPVASYAHRLVIDLYGDNGSDPIGALIHQQVSKKVPSPTLSTNDPRGVASQNPPGGSRANSASQTTKPSAPQPKDALDRQATPPDGENKDLSASRSNTPSGDGQRGRVREQRRTGATQPLTYTVVIDPGHGGEDPGAIGPAGTKEKDVVLNVARKLQERLMQTPIHGRVIKAYLTREGDYFVPLNRRVEKAQAWKADLFISIHADAFSASSARGASVFALSQSGASSSAAKWMADKENSADLVGGINLKSKDATIQRVMLDMSTSAQIRDSIKVGDVLLRRIGRIATLHKKTVEQAGFAVLKAPDIPSVLVETAFISNPDEEALLRSAGFQQEIAEALVQGVSAYLQQSGSSTKIRQT